MIKSPHTRWIFTEDNNGTVQTTRGRTHNSIFSFAFIVDAEVAFEI